MGLVLLVQVLLNLKYLFTSPNLHGPLFKDEITGICCLLLIGISERVADIKTRAFAMKCLTTFSEAAGPGFIFERVSLLILYILIFVEISECFSC